MCPDEVLTDVKDFLHIALDSLDGISGRLLEVLLFFKSEYRAGW
jgi:hypothetical protein